MNPGLYLVHKPVGETSFSLVQAFMEEVRAAGIRRDRLPVCHGGALDPFAEGLVVLLAGQATRLMDLLHPAPKVYEAQIAWGAETDNGDALGRVTATADASALTEARLDEALRPLLGWRDQVPEAFSNKRVGGERAYEKAHRGEAVSLAPVRVYLHEARFVAHDLPRQSTLRLVCGGGFYVRALARELGRATGALAHVARLRRSAIGPWSDPGAGRRVALRGGELFPWCASRELSEAELRMLRNGERIPRGEVAPPPWPLAEGFARPQQVRGMREGFLAALLRPEGELLEAAPLLKSSI